MSYASWCDKYYPITAKEAVEQWIGGDKKNIYKKDTLSLIDHAIQKWSGLGKKTLRKHGLRLIPSFDTMQIYDDIHPKLIISGISCTFCILCSKYPENSTTINTRANSASTPIDLAIDFCCENCPIVKLTGNTCLQGTASPWDIFICSGNPLPMQKLLTKIRKLHLTK